MLTTLAFGLALAASQQNDRPQAWVVTERGPWGTLALDRASVRQQDGVHLFRTVAIPANGGRMLGEPYAYQINYWHADCESLRAASSDSEEFGEDGERVRYDRPVIAPMGALAALPADTPIRRLAEGACSGHWNDAETLPSAWDVYRAR